MITPLPVRFLFVILLGFTSSLAHAQLSWIERALTLTAESGAESVTAVFPFKNTGDHAVTISAVKPDCGCTTATLTKTTYAPGEAGEIKAIFAIGNRVGLQRKAIHVTTDDNPTQPVELVFSVTVPPLLTMQPRLVWWARNDEPTTQTVSLQLNPSSDSTITSVAADSEGITYQLQRLSNSEYRLHLTPSDTSHPRKVRFWVRVRRPGQEAHSFIVFAQVR